MARKGATAENTEAPAEKPAKEVKPKVSETREAGPTTTRTGAQALAVETEQGVRTFTAGGEKGARIAELLSTRNDLSRKQIAELVGCSQSRVAEVARVLGMTKARVPKDTEAEVA